MNIAAMKTVIDRIETLEAELAAARTELRALVDGDEDAPIPLVPTARGERVGRRKPRPVKAAPVKAAPKPTARRQVSPEALDAVRGVIGYTPLPAAVIAERAKLRHPTTLAALGQLVADGTAVKTGDRQWMLADDDADADADFDVIDADGEELED